MVPCSASCFIYSSFRSSSDWDLRPKPTLVGNVDPRRFATFEMGDGEMASNQYVKGERSMDTWTGVILHPPQRTIDEVRRRGRGRGGRMQGRPRRTFVLTLSPHPERVVVHG